MVSLNRKKKNQFEQAFIGNASLDKSLLGQKSAWTTMSLDKSPLDNCLLGLRSLGQLLQHHYLLCRNPLMDDVLWKTTYDGKRPLMGRTLKCYLEVGPLGKYKNKLVLCWDQPLS